MKTYLIAPLLLFLIPLLPLLFSPKREALAKKNETKMKCLSHLPFYILIFALIANKSSISKKFYFNFCYFYFGIQSSLIMPFMSHLINYDFTLILLQHSGFLNLSFRHFISKIPQCDTWCSYTPLQFHALYTLSGRGITNLPSFRTFRPQNEQTKLKGKENTSLGK